MRRAALLVVLAGCLDSLGPEVGPAQSNRCLSSDSDPDHDVSFRRDIAPILSARCANCHTPGGNTPIGIEIGRLDLSSYDTLRAGGAVSGANIVVPGDPCASVIVQKLGPGPPFGSRMPLNGILSATSLQLIHDWIAEGALDD
jgi:hypothetical protein